IDSTAGSKTDAAIVISDSYVVHGLTLTISLTYPNDPDLDGYLIAPDGTKVQIFSSVGSTGSKANFTNTTFDDAAATPIQNGGPPFFGTFNPRFPVEPTLEKI